MLVKNAELNRLPSVWIIKSWILASAIPIRKLCPGTTDNRCRPFLRRPALGTRAVVGEGSPISKTEGARSLTTHGHVLEKCSYWT